MVYLIRPACAHLAVLHAFVARRALAPASWRGRQPRWHLEQLYANRVPARVRTSRARRRSGSGVGVTGPYVQREIR